MFSIAVAAYVTPGLLIGERYMTMSQVMAKAFLNLRDFQLGATMASIMLVIALIIVFAVTYLARTANQELSHGGASAGSSAPLMLALVLLFLALPILTGDPDLVLGLAGVLVPAAGFLAALVRAISATPTRCCPRSGSRRRSHSCRPASRW